METIENAASKVGRTLRDSLSPRPIIADTEQEAWDKAEWIAEETASRIELAKERMAGRQETQQRPREVSATLLFRRPSKPSGTTSVGRKRLIEMSADQDVYDEPLWMKVANLTGGGRKLDRPGGHSRPGRRGDVALLRPWNHDAAAEGLSSSRRRNPLWRAPALPDREGAARRDTAATG